MSCELLERRIGGCKHLQAETSVKRPRSHFGARKALSDPVVSLVGGRLPEGLVDAEERRQFVLEPKAHDRPPKCRPVAAQLPPHLAGWSNPVLRLGQWVNAQVGERDALPVKEAKDVMVGPHQERYGIGVWFVAGEHRCVDVAVRRDEREASDLLVKCSCYLA